MALKGTLKDFGIADILQLIGQQTKTGQLHLKAKDQEVQIAFKDGNIVRAESSSRKQKDLIGAMLVRAELLKPEQLDFALIAQKRTLQRLGDVLVSQGTISADKFKQMVGLQNTETLYKLFSWKTGSYEFEQCDVETDPMFDPLRAETVLMEGFRMVDEWPVVRRKITSYAVTFEKLKELPPPALAADSFDDALDDAFGEKKESSKGSEFQSIGEGERRLYNLVNSTRTVRKLIDVGCLGEFETCKSLCNLVNLDYLRMVPASKAAADDDMEGELTFVERASGAVGRVLVTALVLLGLIFIGSRLDFGAVKVGTSATTYNDPASQRFISRQQISRIEAALGLYRLEKGEVPEKLAALVPEHLDRLLDVFAVHRVPRLVNHLQLPEQR
ncbi:MAG: transcriptional regulator, partial [Myxococcaceae bacterium]|nr:transcriptional regulator [Myxococcaceae bacterium]